MIKFSIVPGYNTEKPNRGSEEAAGIDVFVPSINDTFQQDFKKANNGKSYALIDAEHIILKPQCRVILPTGLKFNIDKGEYLEVANRGSVAAKQGLIFGAHIIDSDYQGNVFINLINTSNEIVYIDYGQKIAQLLHKEVKMTEPTFVEYDDLYDWESDRGAGALGSTGK